MRKLRKDSYDGQCSESGRELLYKMLLDPDMTLEQVQSRCTPWKAGPKKGQFPTVRTLENVAARARAAKLREQMEDAGEILTTARDDVPEILQTAPHRFLNPICNLLAKELLEETIKGGDLRTRTTLMRHLLGYERIRVEKMKCQFRTADDFAVWYNELGPGKEALEEKIQAGRDTFRIWFGWLAFAEDWSLEGMREDQQRSIDQENQRRKEKGLPPHPPLTTEQLLAQRPELTGIPAVLPEGIRRQKPDWIKDIEREQRKLQEEGKLTPEANRRFLEQKVAVMAPHYPELLHPEAQGQQDQQALERSAKDQEQNLTP